MEKYFYLRPFFIRLNKKVTLVSISFKTFNLHSAFFKKVTLLMNGKQTYTSSAWKQIFIMFETFSDSYSIIKWIDIRIPVKFCGDKSILVFGIKFLAKQACSINVFLKTTTTNWKPHIIHQKFRNRIIVEDRWSNGDVSESDRVVISFICNWKIIGVIIIIF